MLQGFSTPLSGSGNSSLAPTPPWHYVSDFLTIEFWAAPEAVQSLLPEGFSLTQEQPGRCFIHFTDNQYTSDRLGEHRDPAASQYQESFVVLEARWRDQTVGFVPYIFVDNDNAMMRGLIQGMPKQAGTVRMTRPYGLQSPAAPQLDQPGEYFATLTHRERRIVNAAVTLQEKTAAPLPLPATMLNYRYFPALEKARQHQPLVYDLVRQKRRDIVLSETWVGSATLEFLETPWNELPALQPVRVGRGFRYSRAMTIDDLELVEALAAPAR